MPALLNDEVFVVYYSLLEWEDTEGLQLFTIFFDHEDTMMLLMRVLHGIKHDSPPDLVVDPRDWSLFILDVFLQFAADTGINNINSVIKQQDRNTIADRSESIILSGPANYNHNFLRNEQLLINALMAGQA